MTLHGDVVVIGAGPAGASSALFLAEAGLHVVLVDKARFPRPKACGEGIMPAGLPLLAELGALEAVQAEGRRFQGVRFASPNGIVAEGRFPEDRYGIILDRERLDQLLLEKAKACPRITVVEGFRVVRLSRQETDEWVVEAMETGGNGQASPQKFCARWVLAADGAHSQAAKLLGIERRPPRRVRLGLRAHFDGIEGLGEFVEVFLMPGYEIYLAPHAGPEGRALIALLLDKPRAAALGGNIKEGFLAALAACGPLKERIRRAAQRTTIMGLGPLGGSAERWEGKGWLLVGDAASSLDPITGEGIALALHSGRLAARQVAAALGNNGSWPRDSYTWKRRRLLLNKRLLEGFILGVSRHPRFSNHVLSLLHRCPRLFSAMLSDC